MLVSSRSWIYPTNNFGHHNNVQYYFYSRYAAQGNNWSSYGLHEVQIKNETDKVVEVVGWTMKDGRVEEDFRVNEVKPALFYTARIVPSSYGKARNIRGAVVFKFKGTNEFFTLAFEDSFVDLVNGNGFRGHIEQGNDVERALANLKDNSPK